MILYFANREFNIQGLASTNLDSEYIILSDTKTESIEKHISTFDAEISFNDDNRKALEEMTNAGNYILRHVSEETSDVLDPLTTIKSAYRQTNVTDCFTIIESEIDIQGKTITIYAEDLGLDLLNDLAYPYSTSSNKTAASYISHFVSKAGFTIGTDEMSEKSLVVNWSDTATVTERLNSIAEIFECELRYSFVIEGMMVKEKHVDIFKKRGIDTYERLSIGRNLNNIKVKRVVTNLATALLPTGDNGLDLSSYIYDDGDFYLADGVLYSRDALKNWNRYMTETGHIFRSYSDNSTQQKDLLDNAIKELKKIREPEVNYEIDIAVLPEGLGVGDRVYIIDDAGELYVQGRILELKTSIVSNKREATIGDYKIKTSGISSVVQGLADEFKEVAARRVLYTWVVYAEDISGTNPSMERDSRNFLGLLPNKLQELTSDDQLTSEALSGIEWSFMLDSEAASTAVITLTASNGVIYKGVTIETDINAVVTIGDTVIQTKQQLQQYFGNTAELIWYVNGEEIQNEGNFVYHYAGAGVEAVIIDCELEVS